MSENVDKIIAKVQASYDMKLAFEIEKARDSCKLPYCDKTYEAIISGGTLYIKGWNGELVINKLGFEGRGKPALYAIREPIAIPNVSFYGILHIGSDQAIGIATNSPISFHGATHTLDMPPEIITGFACRGYNDWPNTLEDIKINCAIAANSFSIINVSTIHSDSIICPKNMDCLELVKFVKQHGRGITPGTKDFNKLFRLVL